MGFKADTSFLKYLTMGAAGVRATTGALRDRGFAPIELERYSSSNKLWSTKVKRLRLPDILCVRTGVRFEVKVKSQLKIRMSDATNNPVRQWDVGLRNDDVVAFVASDARAGDVTRLGHPVFFSTGDLRASVDTTRLGPPKSASEGAERDREWPSIVPSEDGRVVAVSREAISTVLRSGRRQTYQLKGKIPYVVANDEFYGGASIIAGSAPRLAPLNALLRVRWNPRQALRAEDALDRYAAAKAVPHLEEAAAWRIADLQSALCAEADGRVALEIASALARLGNEDGWDYFEREIWGNGSAELRMETVLILAELGTQRAAGQLRRVASSANFVGDEIRQAAVWGLGKSGARNYSDLRLFIADPEDDVALHAVAAFGADTPRDVIEPLVELLVSGTPRERAGACEALRLIGSDVALNLIIRAARTRRPPVPAILAALGRFGAEDVRRALAGDAMLAAVEPVLVLGAEENWLARKGTASDLDFLLDQNL